MNLYQTISLLVISGVNLLIGTDSGLVLLDRSGEGKVYPLISRKRFQQMDVLESQNILVCIAGKKAVVGLEPTTYNPRKKNVGTL